MNRAARVRAAVVAATAAVLLGGCTGSDDNPEAEGSPSPSPSPSPTTFVEVPEGTELTEPGSHLSFGESATVVYEQNDERGTVLEVTVTRARQGRIRDFSGFIVEDEVRRSRPFYVDVTVRNIGEGNVGGAAVPVWGVDGTNTLLPAATFTAPFAPCGSTPLPRPFAAGDEVETCLVFLAPDRGSLEAVSYRPSQEVHPVTWTGEVEPPQQQRQRGRRGGGND